jgi:hypothetical protein
VNKEEKMAGMPEEMGEVLIKLLVIAQEHLTISVIRTRNSKVRSTLNCATLDLSTDLTNLFINNKIKAIQEHILFHYMCDDMRQHWAQSVSLGQQETPLIIIYVS